MKKTVLVFLAVLVALTSVFAVKAGVDFKLDAKGNLSAITSPSSLIDFTKLHITAKPYYTNGYWDIAGKLDFGFDGVCVPPTFNYYESSKKVFYSTIGTLVDLLGDGAPSFAALVLVLPSIDRFVFDNGTIKTGLVRDEQMNVTTLGTGKYTKSNSFASPYMTSEVEGIEVEYPGSYAPVDPALSSVFELEKNGFSFNIFIENVDIISELEGVIISSYNLDISDVAGLEVVSPSLFTKGLTYRTSALAGIDFYLDLDDKVADYSYYVTPEFGLTFDTELSGKPIRFSVAAETDIRFVETIDETTSTNFSTLGEGLGLAVQAGVELFDGNNTISVDEYVIKNERHEYAPLFRNVNVGQDIVIGGDVNFAKALSDNGKVYVGSGTAFSILSGFAFVEENTTDSDLASLDYIKAGVKVGTDKWFAFDAEMDAFYATLFNRSSIEEVVLPWDMFKFSAGFGSNFENGTWKFNVTTGPKYDLEAAFSALGGGSFPSLLDVLDLYGSFQLTYKLGN